MRVPIRLPHTIDMPYPINIRFILIAIAIKKLLSLNPSNKESKTFAGEGNIYSGQTLAQTTICQITNSAE
jgi:hypothetical protein